MIRAASLAIGAAALLTATQVWAADVSAEALTAHNALRAKHGVPALAWSSSLAKSAEAVAKQCVFEHSQTTNGENLAQGSTGGYSATQFVNDWYSEIGAYDFASGNSTGGDIGHFTQVVWKSTQSVGCAMQSCGDNDLFVCQYAPAGNVAGQYLDNVPPAR